MRPEEASYALAPPRRRRVMLVAGEASGDHHGADLVRALRAREPDVEIVGIGGESLRAAGMRTVADAAELATVGVVEGVGRLGLLLRVYRTIVRMIREDPPDLCILVDFPEFNLRVARAAKRVGVPVLYYIAPQVWAWRSGRVRTIARRVDRLAVVFPFEAALYPAAKQVEFVGHPLLDRAHGTRDREETLRVHGLDPGRRLVLLLPGSRVKEVESLLPELLEAARLLGARGDVQFALGLAHTLDPDVVAARVAAGGVTVPVIGGDTYNLMAAADIAIVASGTATLECALLECPMVIVYRVARLTYAIGRLLVRGVRHIGLPNIVAGRRVVPELLQGAARGPTIAAAVAEILDTPGRREAMAQDLRSVRERLGRGGAAVRAATIAVEMMEASRRS